jgi:predicted enzyme related to lactoylglutathione lyase|tara:strand:- start:13679 stop:14110 length:432 start_codon:yes stop_codon:yes gene_type:complete
MLSSGPIMKEGKHGMPVLGMGGLFFRAHDPDALNAWYRTHLGVGAGCVSDPDAQPDEWTWRTLGGPMVFAAFKADSDYFAADKAFMINLRVSDLDSLLTGLRDAGIAVITNAEWDHPDVGRFARIHDPEGNAIELWEPPAPAA